MLVDEPLFLDGASSPIEGLGLVQLNEEKIVEVMGEDLVMGEGKLASSEILVYPLEEPLAEATNAPSQPLVHNNPLPLLDSENFNFFLTKNEEYFMHLETHGVILFFLHCMVDEDAFNCWCLLHWEAKGISLNSYQGLGWKYVCLLFNSSVVAR
jgi:hypothetical protein